MAVHQARMTGNSDRLPSFRNHICESVSSTSFRLPYRLLGTTLQEFIKLYNNLSEIKGSLGATMMLICWTAP